MTYMKEQLVCFRHLASNTDREVIEWHVLVANDPQEPVGVPVIR